MLAAHTKSLLELFDRVELLALPTVPVFAPRLDQISDETLLPWVVQLSGLTAPFNPAGVPCTAQPIPAQDSRLPASLQLVGPKYSEELLVSTAARVEQAIHAFPAGVTGPVGR
jgi:Asp-tRNA(Asn)/Glu-tRNA(Gln) amidotransferase A subunit family amidase